MEEEKTRKVEMTSNTCFYHEEKTAKTTCYACSRPICSEDRIERKHISRNKQGNVISEPLILCKFCDVNKKMHTRNAFSSLLVGLLTIVIIIPSAIGLGFIIIGLGGWDTLVQTQNYNTIVMTTLTIMLVLGITAVLFLPLLLKKRRQMTEIVGRKKLNALRKERSEFLDSVTSTKARKLLQQKRTTKNIYCSKCGEQILERETYCGQCGAKLLRKVPL